LKIILLFILTLFIASFAYSEVSHDVLLEKLTNLNTQIADVKTLIEKRDLKISDLETSQAKINKEIGEKINSVMLVQGEQSVKINIIWGILGTAIGGGSTITGLRLYNRKKNGNSKEVK